MTNSLITNLSYDSYISHMIKYEKILEEYKTQFVKLGYIITHPSFQEVSKRMEKDIKEIYPNECNAFGSAYSFIMSIVALNYHLGSIILLDKMFNVTDLKNMRFSLPFEDLICISNFSKLMEV